MQTTFQRTLTSNTVTATTTPPPLWGGGSQYSHHSHTGQTQHCGTTVRDGGYHDHVPERLGHTPKNEPATSHAHAHSDRSTKVGGRNDDTKRGRRKPGKRAQLATMVTDDEGGEEDGEEEVPIVQLQPFHHHPPRPSFLRVQPRYSTLQIRLKQLRIYKNAEPSHTEVKHKLPRYTPTKLTATKGDMFRRASSYTERNLKQVVYLLRKKGME